MARYVANVDITAETWGQLIVRTNQLLDALSSEVLTANATWANTGNTTVPRNAQLYGTFVVNTAYIATTLSGGSNTTTKDTLRVSSNVEFGTGSDRFDSRANSLYTNTQFWTANLAGNGAAFSINPLANADARATELSVNTTQITVRGGSIVLKSNTSVDAVAIVSNTTATNTTISGTNFNVSANISATGTNHSVAGNTNFDAGTLFVDGVNNRIGVGTTTPDATVQVSGTANVSGATRLASTLAVIGAATLSNTIAVTGNATLSNTLSVTGNVTFLSTGLHTIAGNVNFDGNTLFVDSVNNRVGVLTPTPDAVLSVNGTANVAGAVRIGGNTTLQGNATLNGTLQTISGNVNVDSGVLFVDSVNNRVGINNTAPDAAVTVTGAANVSSDVRIGGNTTAVGNVTISGSSHTVAGNVNFDTATVFIDSVNDRLGVGTATPDARLQVNGAANVSGAARFGSTMTVIGAASITNTVAAGNTTVTGFVNATSSGQFGGALTVAGAAAISNTLAVGNTTLTGFITISSTANVSGTLTVNGATIVGNTLAVGNTTVTGFINVSSSANVAGPLQVGGNTTVAGNVVISGTSHTVAGNSNFDAGTLFVDSVNDRVGVKTTTPDATLAVTGTANVSGNVALGNNLTVAGNASVTGAISFGGAASVGGSLTVKSDYQIDVSANGNIGTNAAARVIYAFPKASFRTGKMMVFANNSNGTANVNQIAEMVLAHDNLNTAYVSVYGVVGSPANANTLAPLGTFTAQINTTSNNVELLMNQVFSNTAVKVVAHLIV